MLHRETCKRLDGVDENLFKYGHGKKELKIGLVFCKQAWGTCGLAKLQITLGGQQMIGQFAMRMEET
jgi:hypothetical protein